MIKPQVSVLLASRGRSRLLKETIERIGNTTRINIELCIGLEDDLRSLFTAERSPVPEHVIKHISYLDKVAHPNATWNRLLKISAADIIVLAGDDSIHKQDWLENALRAHQEQLNGYGMVGLNDLAWKKDALCTTPLYDKKFCREVLGGVCFVPHYHQYFGDFENWEKAKRSGHYFWCEEAVVEHKQEDFPNDESKMHAQKWAHSDGKLLDRRVAEGFPKDYDSII